jgi:hypothetical protein
MLVKARHQQKLVLKSVVGVASLGGKKEQAALALVQTVLHYGVGAV